MRVEDVELKNFKNSLTSLALYKEGVEKLKASGIFNFLRIFSRPFTPDRGANPYTSAYTAAFCEGYHKCLDDIIYFEELHLTEEVGRANIKANFGGLSIALAKGDLTKEEVNGKR